MNKLKSRRVAKKLTAIQLGKLAEVHEMRVFALERGRFRARRDEAERLARALDCTVEQLGLEVREP